MTYLSHYYAWQRLAASIDHCRHLSITSQSFTSQIHTLPTVRVTERSTMKSLFTSSNFFGIPLSQATVSIISYLQRPLLAIPIGYAIDSILINSPLSSFRNIKTASLIDAFLKSCSCHANIALLVMLYCMLYILCVCSACIVLVCGLWKGVRLSCLNKGNLLTYF